MSDIRDNRFGDGNSGFASRPSNDRLVTGLYRTPSDAERAYNDLRSRHGYRDEDISVLMSDETRQRHFGNVKPGEEFKKDTKALEGAGVGSIIGGTLGAIIGGIAAIGTNVLLPGIGLVVAGPLAAAFAGAGAGGAAGGLIGALIGAGIPEDRAREYEQGLRDGGIVLGARARDDRHALDLERDLTSYGGYHVRR